MGISEGYLGIINDGISYKQLQSRLYKTIKENYAIVAWKPYAKWLPYFDESLYGSFGANLECAKQLSEKLNFPVLIFSIFDSDVLFLYYCDAKSGILESWAKSNVGPVWSVFVEDPAEASFFPSEDLPDFLLPLCDGKKLREVWERDDYVFADDRLIDLCKLLNSEPIEDFDNLPEGFEKLQV